MVKVYEWGDYMWRLELRGDNVYLERYAMPNSDFPHVVVVTSVSKLLTSQKYRDSSGAHILGMIYGDAHFGTNLEDEESLEEHPVRGCDVMMLIAHIVKEGKLTDWED